MKHPLGGTSEFLAIVPPEVIAAARETLKQPRLRETTKQKIEAGIARVERLDSIAMHIIGKHPGNPDWMDAANNAAQAAWDLKLLIG